MPSYRTSRATRPLQDERFVSASFYGRWYAHQGGDREDLDHDMRQCVKYSGSPGGTIEEDVAQAQTAFDKEMAMLRRTPWKPLPTEEG